MLLPGYAEMNLRRILVALLPIVGALLLFWTDAAVLQPNRERSAMNSALDAFTFSMRQLSETVAESMDSGYLSSFASQTNPPASGLREMESWSGYIHSAYILNSAYTLKALSGKIDNRDLASIAREIQTERQENIYYTLTQSGLFLTAKILSENGNTNYLLLKLSPPISTGIAAGFAKPGGTPLYLYPENMIGGENALGISLLDFTSRHKYRLRETFWKEAGFLFLMVFPPPGFLDLPTLLLIPVALLAGALLFFRLDPQRQKSEEEQKETIRKTLESQKKTLEHLRKNLEEHRIQPKISLEKIVESLPADGEMPEAVFSAAPAKEGARKDVVELIATEREFIFPNPFLPEWNPSPSLTVSKLPERAARIRNRVFSDDAKQLIAELSSTPESGDPKVHALLRIRNIEKEYANPAVGEWTTYLNEVYFDPITIDEIMHIMQIINDELHGNGTFLMRYNPYYGCYETFATARTEPGSQLFMYMLQNDPIIPSEPKEMVFTEISDELREDPYFKKRFLPETADRIGSFATISLHRHFLNSFVVTLFNKGNNAARDSLAIRNSIHLKLHEVMPAIHYFFNDQSPYSHANQTQEMLKEMRSITGHAREKATVLHIQSKTMLNDDIFRSVELAFADVLGEDERLLFNTPSHFIFLLRETTGSTVKSRISELLNDLVIEELSFPDLGKNFYSYL